MTPSAMDPTLLSTLAAMPPHLETALARVPAARRTSAPRDGGFSIVEHAWHLADLEREGYGERIRRIVAENQPALPDFEGDRIARERRYSTLDAREGAQLFTAARAENLAALGRATAAERARCGTQDGVGRVTLDDVARMMAEHDRGHREEIEALLNELGA
jgi:DinB superfamily